MKAVMVMFDSLNRHMLPSYGCDWVHAPNFQRLAERTATFDRAYIGSMPCMPARREIHTGRYNFLHRSWGPIEPFDDSMPQMLRENGIHSHLVSDHYHYWEDGGCTYHNRYTTWDAVRGQESDRCFGDVRQPPVPQNINGRSCRQTWVNRRHMPNESDMPQPQTFARGLEFLRTNAAEDNWFLHIETFDPHEPYIVPERFLKLYDQIDEGPLFDWPGYRPLQESPEMVRHIRVRNAALISMCDEYLGKVLDAMDELGLWDDTMLIVNTDHGFLLGEHESWGKCWCPWYEEHAHTPLFVWDPREPAAAGQRRSALVQTIDLAPTLLEYFGIERTPDMQGAPLRQTLADDTPVREGGLFGLWGSQVNVTDGRYVYMRAPVGDNTPLFQYTHMPTHLSQLFSVEEMRTAEMAPPFAFTKGCPVMKIASDSWDSRGPLGDRGRTMLFDIQNDPQQQQPIDDPTVEKRMIDLLVQLMKDSDAPAEQFVRLGLT